MHVLRFAKRSILTVAAVCGALTGCGQTSPDAPFNPTGTSADLTAVSSTFESSTFASFSSLSPLFDAAIGSPMVSASAGALNFRRATGPAGLRAAAVRSAQRMSAMMSARNESFSASSAAIPATVAGKVFVYDIATGAYVASDIAGAPSNGVRFLLYAINPVTRLPARPLNAVGYVDLTDMGAGNTKAARVEVVSGTTTYLDYTVSATSGVSSGWATVIGFVTNGTTRANFNLRSTLTFSAGISLAYSLDVPQRDLSIDLTLTTTGLDPQTGNIDVDLTLHGPNGSVRLSGQFTTAGGTLTVQVNGRLFATITTSTGADPVITGAQGQPLTTDDVDALSKVFKVTGGAFSSFDELLAPAGGFLNTTP